MSDVKRAPFVPYWVQGTYSKEAMDKALDLCRRWNPWLAENHVTPRIFAAYIQQVSDAVKKADEALKEEGYRARSGIRAELRQFILSDPVDPLLREAREIVAKVARRRNRDAYAEAVLRGDWDQAPDVQSALAALKSREAK